MKLYFMSLIILGLFYFSCNNAQNISDKVDVAKLDQENSVMDSKESENNEKDIDKALDALTQIQVSGDGGRTLYLTFPNISHNECQGLISIFEISREEFHDALRDAMSKNNSRLTDLEKSTLASVASLPSSRYKVTTCGAITKLSESNNGAIPPRKGTWIIPAIFGVSDLLINW